jgi:hypothetical protein
MERIKISPHQCLLLLTAPALDLFFPVEGLVDAIEYFEIDKLHSQAFFGMVGTFPILVLLQSAIQVFSTARIVTTIGAFQDIHVAFHIKVTPF